MKTLKLNEVEPRKVLESLIAERLTAILSYTSRDKWHATDVMPVSLGANSVYFEISAHKKGYPMNISIGQQVGISLKYDHGKIIFETSVLGFEPSPDRTGGGIIIVEMPSEIKTVSRRSYFRVAVPKSVGVEVSMRRHGHNPTDSVSQADGCWTGDLIDISAGGLQVGVEAYRKPNFKEGQFVDLEFCPMHGAQTLKFKALVRCILPSADEKSICIGMQIIGLEASTEGREVLQQICQVVELYHRMNHSHDKQWSFMEGN